jgi:hypothetical protein
VTALWVFSNIFYWLEYLGVIILIIASIVFMFRRDVINRVSAILLCAAIVLASATLLFDYNRAPRLSEKDLAEIHQKIEASDFDELLSRIEVPEGESRLSFGFGEITDFDEAGSLSSRLEGGVTVYEDIEDLNADFDFYSSDDLFSFIPVNKPSYYENGQFIAWSSRYERNFNIKFIPFDNYFYSSTVIRYKNAVIYVSEYTDIARESKIKDYMLNTFDYGGILTGKPQNY